MPTLASVPIMRRDRIIPFLQKWQCFLPISNHNPLQFGRQGAVLWRALHSHALGTEMMSSWSLRSIFI